MRLGGASGIKKKGMWEELPMERKLRLFFQPWNYRSLREKRNSVLLSETKLAYQKTKSLF